MGWIKWVAAACIVLAVGLTYFVISKRSEKCPPIAQTQDVKPPSNTRAVITLADGSKVYLDSANNGTIAQQNSVNVIKTADGKIVYSSDHQITGSPITYNTLSNPRGSKVIDMTLSDGSHVWLNAGSSITYPVAFTGKERIVEMTGEAYFEVKHNSKQPFKVHLPNGSVVEDIGTAFNVNAYSDEADIKTTLIEGSVRVIAEARGPAGRDPRQTPGVDRGVILKPGEQAVLTHDSRLTIDHPDLDVVIAWKEGSFYFDNSDLRSILREFARWYDIEVVYEGPVTNRKFFGIVKRSNSLKQVLQLLQDNNIVYSIEGKKLIVKSS
jgi:ferric-dicitrate binding protein FerR (iron transport regulator)